jgi:hypothetical protein
MKTTLKKTTFILSLICTIVLSACSNESKLVGSWKSKDGEGTQILVLTKKGEFISTETTKGYRTEGTYQFAGNNIIDMKASDYGAIAGTATYEIEFSDWGNQLKMKDPRNNSTETYRRMK